MRKKIKLKEKQQRTKILYEKKSRKKSKIITRIHYGALTVSVSIMNPTLERNSRKLNTII